MGGITLGAVMPSRASRKEECHKDCPSCHNEKSCFHQTHNNNRKEGGLHVSCLNLKRAVQSRGSATELFIPMPDKPSRELEKDLIAMHDRLKHLSP